MTSFNYARLLCLQLLCLWSYDHGHAVAVIQYGSARPKINSEHLGDIGFHTNSLANFWSIHVLISLQLFSISLSGTTGVMLHKFYFLHLASNSTSKCGHEALMVFTWTFTTSFDHPTTTWSKTTKLQDDMIQSCGTIFDHRTMTWS
jgi:hypothetical protein